MNTRFRKFALTTLLLVALSPIFGQGSLKIVAITGWPDTVHCYSLYPTFTISIKNTDSNFLYMGQFSVLLKNTDTSHSQVDTLIHNHSDSIGPMLTHSYQVSNYSFTPGAYAAGHDVVIVWPVSFTASHVDSLRDSTYFICTAGIPEYSNGKSLFIYPNPANEVLYFVFNNASSALKEVRIYNVPGQEINRYQAVRNSIPINELPRGFYCIEFLLKDGTILREKFMKE